MCLDEPLEAISRVGSRVSAIMTRWGMVRGQELLARADQGLGIVQVIPCRQEFNLEAGLTGAVDCLAQNALCAPLDALKQTAVRVLEADQVIASVISRTEHAPIARLPKQLNRALQEPGGQRWAVRTDQTY